MKTVPLVWPALLVLALVAGCGDGSEFDTDPAGEVLAYNVEISVEGTARFGALQLSIEHLGRSGGFIGRGDSTDCQPLVDAIFASNSVGERTLKVGMISLAGVRTPARLMNCGFRTHEDLDADDFAIDVVDASDTNSQELDPVPSAIVSRISLR